MATSFIQRTDSVKWVNGTGSAVSSGDVVVVGLLGLGIATTDIANAASGSVDIGGVHDLTKATGFATTIGQKLFWDASAENLTTTAKDNYFVGYAEEVTVSGATTCKVRLAPFADEGAREITMAATGNQIPAAQNFYNGSGLVIECPNTAAHNLTFPAMSTVPLGMFVTVHKTSADAQAITVAANASDTLIGSTGTIDADNDRATLQTTSAGPVVIATTIA